MDRSLVQQRQFTSDASHELLTPLAGLRAQLEEALLHPDETDLSELLCHALGDVHRLQAIVTDLLLLTQVGSGMPDGLVRVDLAELVRAAVCQRGDELPVQLLLAPGATVNVVETEIHRVLTNLLDNAQRHARRTVLVEVRRNGDRAELVVADDGDGIADTDRERIFERFTRLDTARCRNRGGTGLGLAIVRDVVEAHRGTIEVGESAVGGARFVLFLPLADGSSSAR
ncbi:HAMP domain-containing sensor histidine kinase [Streptosporangium subroseum]|uniref:sensor histidine kinase n=1 Tax=Streptosporangium subroseum TaxID=106412 RepID=UPI0034149183